MLKVVENVMRLLTIYCQTSDYYRLVGKIRSCTSLFGYGYRWPRRMRMRIFSAALVSNFLTVIITLFLIRDSHDGKEIKRSKNPARILISHSYTPFLTQICVCSTDVDVFYMFLLLIIYLVSFINKATC